MTTTNPWSAVHKVFTKLSAVLMVFFVLSAHGQQVEIQGIQAPQLETLFISDIDDTIKVTHVLDRWDMVQNAMRTDNTFLGMTSVYQILSSANKDMVFAYLSNAPEAIMYRWHEGLLKEAKFPAGELYCRENTSDNEHKNRTIRMLIQKYDPKNVILIGDNAEQDTMIYNRAVAESPNVNFKVYIHQLYSVSAKSETGKKLEKNQIGFVTAVDLAMDWHSSGLLPQSHFNAWVTQIVPRINEEALDKSKGLVAFPKWMNCRDYKPVREHEVSEPLITQYVEKRDKRCLIR